jgi:hypothetical protein
MSSTVNFLWEKFLPVVVAVPIAIGMFVLLLRVLSFVSDLIHR